MVAPEKEKIPKFFGILTGLGFGDAHRLLYFGLQFIH